jgi:hypothetical protein
LHLLYMKTEVRTQRITKYSLIHKDTNVFGLTFCSEGMPSSLELIKHPQKPHPLHTFTVLSSPTIVHKSVV